MSVYPQPEDIRWHLGYLWQSYRRSHFAANSLFVTFNQLIVVAYR